MILAINELVVICGSLWLCSRPGKTPNAFKGARVSRSHHTHGLVKRKMLSGRDRALVQALVRVPLVPAVGFRSLVLKGLVDDRP